ncbi:LysE/ArgO family amino acid transporter [Umboniibacter marinipuniceus]|uniref:L-lysine exporter family protein LysE/ArgO n=1 Tax=Umboniibacter marinipuniceus TaxID=569599 RepID=A0A3M0AHW2_9GAMM|nr:LysE/ArgO family amino acid transporter [Umboniibacter marinipuniceus]RMA82358.1 L-lysine exporter family protein LysE/ArgO [Umboniibacter marinipuniceus]
MLATFVAGFSLGLSLILAIGSQNAFVLKQGIKRQHVLAVCTVCAISDALLIALGVAGFGAVVTQFPSIEQLARYGGAAFLLIYGALSFKSAFTQQHALEAAENVNASLGKAVLMCLAFTWLNPHVYLDTVILLGSISTQYHPNQLLFALGAMSASLVFFYSLGFGSRFLAPLFSQPRAWRILEFVVGIIMVSIATSLLF